MSEKLDRKSGTMTWSLCVVGVLIAYLLSVPLVELSPMARDLPAGIKMRYQVPWWWLYSHTPLHQPLWAYENFWRRYFNSGTLAPGFGL